MWPFSKILLYDVDSEGDISGGLLSVGVHIDYKFQLTVASYVRQNSKRAAL